MATTSKPKTTTLTTSSRTGTYFHRIAFTSLTDGRVRIVERMIDELMGDWIGNSQDRTVPVTEARAYYRNRRAMGYN